MTTAQMMDTMATTYNESATAARIKSATTAEQDSAVAVIVLAFSSDPVVRWAYPDPHDYLSHFPGFVRAFGGNAFEHGAGYYAEAGAGAALWLPPGVSPREEELGEIIERTLPAETRDAVFAQLEQMAGYHPEGPHWYLPLIGVDPARQSRGHGSALMAHALANCDRDRLPAYLESTNPRNIPLYLRHGFEILGRIEVGPAPPIFPMLRRPRPD